MIRLPLWRLLAAISAFTLLSATNFAAAMGPSVKAAPEMVEIAAGPFLAGSSAQEREAAYKLDEAAYGHSKTRQWGWYDREPAQTTVTLDAYCIMKVPVSNRDYRRFVTLTGHSPPMVTREEWRGYKLIHPFQRTLRHAWKDGDFADGRERHPVVMVSHDDATAYAQWLSEITGRSLRLPSGHQWEKAMRGTTGGWFPWGNIYEPDHLNSHDAGPFDTVPVGSFPQGASPFGVLDGAGQVFEWTSEPAGKGRHLVRGGSWDDKGCGVCRAAARHGRPDRIKHILVGFRLVSDTCEM